MDPLALARDRAAAALRSGRYELAAQRYGALTLKGPAAPHHWLGLGQALMMAGRDAEALQALQRAHELGPDLVDPVLAAADLAHRSGEDELAELFQGEAFAQMEKGRGSGEQRRVLLRQASDRAERRRSWTDVVAMRRRLAELEPHEQAHPAKILFALLQAGRMEDARRFAYADVRAGGDLLRLHELMEACRASDRHRRAQLLCKLLVERWPHSEPHALLYAEMAAARSGLSAGDRALRRSVDRLGRTQAAERAYYRVAFAARDVQQAEARVRAFLARHPDDLEAQAAFAYATATLRGIEAGERKFERIALHFMQDAAALRGLAHLAMRRRDRQLTYRRWRRLCEVYPDDVGAAVESSRASYEAGDAPGALSACRDWRLRHAPNLHMEQYYAHLLAETGNFAAAEATAAACLERFGPTWIAFEALVLARGHLGRLQQTAPELSRLTPAVTSYDDLKRGYQVVRVAEYFGAGAAALRDVLARAECDLDLGWAQPYVERDRPGGPDLRLQRAIAAARTDHARLTRSVDGGLARRWAGVGRRVVDAVLERASASRPHVHVVNMFEQPHGGSELHALDLGERLKTYASVTFWAPESPHPTIQAEHGARSLASDVQHAAPGGVLVLVGVYYDLGPWLAQLQPRRVLVLYNTFDAVKLTAFLREIRRHTGRRAELLYCSDLMQEEVRLPGLFEPSPIDLEHYLYHPRPADRGFTIGRHSRDVVEKHDVRDARVYEALIRAGAEVELLGATCMRGLFLEREELRLLPVQRHGIRNYLGGLDCFYYRTGTWIEPWGRVVVEAMATGLPVVVHERGGYAQAIANGVDGFVFRTDEEAIEQLLRLKNGPALRERMGLAARAKVETLLGPEALRKLLAFYLA